MNRARRTLRRFTNSVLNLGRILGPLAAGGALFQLARSVEVFNRAMTNSLAIMGDVSDAMRNDMKQAAIDVARVTVFSAREVAEAFFFLASAGLSAATSLKALPLVAQFAQAGMFNLSEATSLLTDAQSSLGLKVKDIAQNMRNMVRVGDLLVGANTLADATTREFAEALARAGGRIRLLGVEVETAVAALAAFAERGIKAAEAGTALDITLRELASKAFENAKAFDALGIEVFDDAGRFQSLISIIGQMEEALGGMSDEAKIAAVSMLGLTNKSNKFILQLVGASKEMAEFRDRLLEMQGITQEVADNQMTALQKATARLGAVFIEMGTKGSDTMETLARFINKLTDGVEAIAPVVKRTIDSAIDFFEKWGLTILKIVAAVIVYRTALKAVTLALRAIAAAQAIVKALAGPAGWLQLAASVAIAGAALGVVDSAFATIEKNMGGAQNTVQGLTDAYDDLAAASEGAADSVDQFRIANEQWERIVAELIELSERGVFTVAKFAEIAGKNNAAIEEWIEGSRKLLTTLDDLETRLQFQIDTFGLAADEVEIYRLSMLGLTDAALEHVRALQQQLEALRAQEKMFARARRLVESSLSPLDKRLRDEEALEKALEAGRITAEEHERALKRITDEYNRAVKAAERLAGAAKGPGEFRQVDSIRRLALQGVSMGGVEGEANRLIKRLNEDFNKRMREIDRRLFDEGVVLNAG